MRGRVILSLCDFTGNWPLYCREAGYDVRLVDIQHGRDVRLLPFPVEPVHGILAAPPCTVFAASGNRWPRTAEEIAQSLSVVDACLRLVAVCRPAWWALENPVGKLKRYLGPPAMYFHPCDFGDPYTKKTCLWGNFVPPARLWTTTREVEPEKACPQGSWLQQLSGQGKETKLLRSTTPLGFAKAFFEANP